MVWPASTVCRVLRTKWPGFGGAEGDLDRFAVAHFADQNDLGRLAQGGAEAVGKSVEIRCRVRAG